MNIELTILPLDCHHVNAETREAVSQDICTQSEERVTIFNKIRERFVIEVYASLRMIRVNIDAMDSILPGGSACLDEKRRCCEIEEPSIFEHRVVTNIKANKKSKTVEDCAVYFESLELTDQC